MEKRGKKREREKWGGEKRKWEREGCVSCNTGDLHTGGVYYRRYYGRITYIIHQNPPEGRRPVTRFR